MADAIDRPAVACDDGRPAMGEDTGPTGEADGTRDRRKFLTGGLAAGAAAPGAWSKITIALTGTAPSPVTVAYLAIRT